MRKRVTGRENAKGTERERKRERETEKFMEAEDIRPMLIRSEKYTVMSRAYHGKWSLTETILPTENQLSLGMCVYCQESLLKTTITFGTFRLITPKASDVFYRLYLPPDMEMKVKDVSL